MPSSSAALTSAPLFNRKRTVSSQLRRSRQRQRRRALHFRGRLRAACDECTDDRRVAATGGERQRNVGVLAEPGLLHELDDLEMAVGGGVDERGRTATIFCGEIRLASEQRSGRLPMLPLSAAAISGVLPGFVLRVDVGAARDQELARIRRSRRTPRPSARSCPRGWRRSRRRRARRATFSTGTRLADAAAISTVDAHLVLPVHIRAACDQRFDDRRHDPAPRRASPASSRPCRRHSTFAPAVSKRIDDRRAVRAARRAPAPMAPESETAFTSAPAASAFLHPGKIAEHRCRQQLGIGIVGRLGGVCAASAVGRRLRRRLR